MSEYHPRVASLLRLGALPPNLHWPEHCRYVGFSREHVPDLLRVVTDPSLYTADDDTDEEHEP